MRQRALWITQNRDRDDHFLSAKDALMLERPGLALIHAQEPSEIVLFEPAPRQGLLQRIGRALAAASRACVSRTESPGAMSASSAWACCCSQLENSATPGRASDPRGRTCPGFRSRPG
jgi:hypothetical protein